MRALLALSLLSITGCVDPDAAISPGDETLLDIEVPAGATASGLGPKLIEQGLISSPFQYKVFLKTSGVEVSCLKAGRFRVKRSDSLREVFKTLCGTPLADEVAFTVLEGWRVRDIDAALAAQGLAEPGAYQSVVSGRTVQAPFEVPGSTYEGYLYPETYMVPREGMDPGDLVVRQLSTFKERFLDKHPEGFGKRTLHEVVTMASMLEREEPKPEQRGLVSGILWKRIDAGWQLGVDATSRYTLAEWNDRKAFLKQLRDPEDPYNSRLRKGLPPTPIGNPTLSSLDAAMAPVPSEYWYYLHDATKTLRPAKDADGHEANRKRYDVY